MIQRGTIDGLAEKIDIFYAAGKLTDGHYTELTGLLAAKMCIRDSYRRQSGGYDSRKCNQDGN